METRQRYDDLFMDIAERFAEMSYCEEYKHGSVIVRDRNIVAAGYNGQPKGMVNDCEDERGNLKDTVIHSTTNAILRLAMTGESSDGSTLYTTNYPNIECSKMIVQSGIIRIVYEHIESQTDEEFLKSQGIIVDKYTKLDNGE